MTSDELANTVELPILGEEERARTPDDTDKFELSAATTTTRRQVHSYADGVIRFYRARTILITDRDPEKFDRAWRYLHRLRPQDLPPETRQQFFDLVYMMQEHSGCAVAIPYKFSEKIFAIAERLDAFIDAIDSPSSGSVSSVG